MATPSDQADTPLVAVRPQRVRSGAYRIDLAARDIRRDTTPIDVEAKVFDLIALLIAHPERALSKREIGDALWPDRAVTDAALSQLLRKARRALGDDGETQALIRTVHGRGLQWVGALEADEDTLAAPAASSPAETAPASLPARRGRWGWIALLGVLLAAAAVAVLLGYGTRSEPAAAAAGAPLRVVVLPTVESSGDPELAWVRSGLAGLIGSLIGDGRALETVPAPDPADAGSAPSADDPAALARLHAASGATHAVFTQLRQVGPVAELDVRVIALDSRIEYRDVLRGSAPAAIAVDAAERIRQRLQRPLPQAATEAAGAAGIGDPFVAEAYARGIDAQMRGDAAAAKKYFDICLDHDPNLPWPRLHLATAQIGTGETEAGVANAERVLAAARERGQVMLQVQAARQLASVAFRRGDVEAAAAVLDAAIADLPEPLPPLAQIDLLIAYGSIESERGHWRGSRTRLEQALGQARRLGDRRREASALFNLAVVDNAGGDAEAAIARLRAALDAARAGGDGALEAATLLNLGGAEHNAGRSLEAALLLRRALTLARERTDRQVQVFSAIQLGWVLAAFDRTDTATALADAVLHYAERERNVYWEAEALWLSASLAARDEDWPRALDRLARAQQAFESIGLRRSVAQVLAETVQTAGRAGDGARAQAAADAYRRLAESTDDADRLAERLPLIEAQLRRAGGDAAGAAAALEVFLGARGNDRGPVTQAAVFELGRWLIELGRPEDALALPALGGWLAEQPAARALRIRALRAAGREADAAAEQARLDAAAQAPQLDLPPELLAMP
ncbi:MAG TPA: winged helix-turn-helix domain-containing protein [Dokdonella sp.]|uniref:winged helix-turn-helix domain-containing protein n=1 Tax=Dokdonella sp. TaxID=2291710 RepID=UPI002C0A4714|nr:winged helix-turn-helix domain-containing protein [Dokdonella sp.]HUD41695.1 winged helix-turn-helix domain-containing protein [Dokdonella sp.]